MELLKFNFTDFHYSQIEELAAKNYTPYQIAITLEVSSELLKNALLDENSRVFLAYQKGRLKHQTQLEDAMKISAIMGDGRMIDLLQKRKETTDFENLKNEYLDL
ncbi:hypothetical protein [Aureivirga marina]|uniref:hypothetical protein n=1 Tax=Aureivirga marina TaxID=1182451 RepID=UPI0018CAA020|nr:hypothetical protein [Aureivirga marina]